MWRGNLHKHDDRVGAVPRDHAYDAWWIDKCENGDGDIRDRVDVSVFYWMMCILWSNDNRFLTICIHTKRLYAILVELMWRTVLRYYSYSPLFHNWCAVSRRRRLWWSRCRRSVFECCCAIWYFMIRRKTSSNNRCSHQRFCSTCEECFVDADVMLDVVGRRDDVVTLNSWSGDCGKHQYVYQLSSPRGHGVNTRGVSSLCGPLWWDRYRRSILLFKSMHNECIHVMHEHVIDQIMISYYGTRGMPSLCGRLWWERYRRVM